MARKTHEINPAQGTIFDYNQMPEHDIPQITPSERVPEAVPEPPRPVETVYGPPGSYTDVYERANGLVAAVNAQAQANKRDGFGVAANTREHAGDIYGRYQWGTEAVKDGAEVNAREFSQEAKRKFWHASGYAALKGAGLDEQITAKGVDKRAAKDFREFMSIYATPNNRNSTNARNRFKRQQIRTIKWVEEDNQQKAA